MRAKLAACLLTLLPAMVAAQPASAQARGSVYLSLMGEPFVAPAGQAPLGLWLAKADTDRNGAISLAELTADADRFFKSLDTDGDGRIGGIEMTRYEEQIAPAAVRAAGGLRPVGSDARSRNDISASREDQDRQRAGMRGASMGPQRDLGDSPINAIGGAAGVPQPVAMTDVDMSGSVTVDEFARAAARRFAALDLNKNGLLDQSELTGRR